MCVYIYIHKGIYTYMYVYVCIMSVLKRSPPFWNVYLFKTLKEQIGLFSPSCRSLRCNKQQIGQFGFDHLGVLYVHTSTHTQRAPHLA